MRLRLRDILLVLAFTLLGTVGAQAQYVRVNIDRQTVAAMSAAYGTQAFTEKYYNEQTGKILERYRSAEVAAAAIFASKYLDRKALTNVGIWGDGTENYYYRRIYNLVGAKIMPKIWTVAGMMLNSPQTAIYWGSYLMKICDETKNLCYQFESVVTNSRLSFRDIAFLAIIPEVARLLDLTKIGDMDCKLILDDIANIPGNFTKEQLIGDLDQLYSMASHIVAGGIGNGVELGSGSTQYKCGSCGSSVNAHTGQCAMLTSVSESSAPDTSALTTAENEAKSQIALLQSQIEALETRNAELIRLIASATIEEASAYRQEYNSNKDKITALQSELATWQQNLNDIQAAIAEAEEGESVATDDYYRIPAIMADLKTAYTLTWSDSGAWNGNPYVRYANAQHITGTLKFESEVSIARKPKYFMGIKIHRAIVQISWKLTGEFSDTQVVDIVELNPSASDAEKQRIVDQHISQVAQDYPTCDITTEYVKSETPSVSDNGDTFHLLWASDRLDVAREVEARLTSIYADLVSLEKMMHYKLGVIDVLKGVAPHINDTYGRRQTIIEQSYERWRRSANPNYYGR